MRGGAGGSKSTFAMLIFGPYFSYLLTITRKNVFAFFFQNLFLYFYLSMFHELLIMFESILTKSVFPYYGKVFINCHVWNRVLQN